MNEFLEFIATYFMGLVTYPFYIVYWGISVPVGIVIWLALCVLVIRALRKYGFKKYLKIFVAIFVLPGTIICGAATVIPWPFAVFSAFSEGGCTPVWALFSALILNILCVQIASYLYKLFESMRKVKNA